MQDKREWDDSYKQVKDLVMNRQSNEVVLVELFTEYIVQHIQKVKQPYQSSKGDK